MGNEVRRTKLYFWLFFAAVCSCVCFPKFQDQSALSLFSRLMFGMSPLSYMGLWKYGAQWFHLSVIQDGIDVDTYYGRLCLTVLVLLIPIFLLALRLYYGCIVFWRQEHNQQYYKCKLRGKNERIQGIQQRLDVPWLSVSGGRNFFWDGNTWDVPQGAAFLPKADRCFRILSFWLISGCMLVNSFMS